MLACLSNVLGLVLVGSDTGLSWFFSVAFCLANMTSHLFFGCFFSPSMIAHCLCVVGYGVQVLCFFDSSLRVFFF